MRKKPYLLQAWEIDQEEDMIVSDSCPDNIESKTVLYILTMRTKVACYLNGRLSDLKDQMPIFFGDI